MLHHGFTEWPAGDPVIHHLTDLEELEVIDCAVGHNSNLFIIGPPVEDQGKHLGNYEGLTHCYKKDGKWVVIEEKDYEAKKAELPDVCFALINPQKNLDCIKWPDLDIFKDQLLHDADDH